MIMNILVKYIDDFGIKHICTAQSFKEVEFLKDRFNVLEYEVA